MDVYAWITLITVIAVMGVLLLTKIRTDAVFLIAVNTSFATPIGAPSNMMVYGPGGYRFSDFMRIGVPLTLIVTVTGIAAACLTFPLTPLP